jgi:hypothetical protein
MAIRGERRVELIEQRINGRLQSIFAVQNSDFQESSVSVPSMALV